MAAVDLAKLGLIFLKNATSGEREELRSLWREQAVVIIFLRRFGCQVCRWTAVEISKLKEDLTANSVALVGVGPEEMGLKEFQNELYIDEKKQTYKDLGFKRYNAVSVVPAALGKKVRNIITKANADGIQGNFSGDLLQSGGMVIIAKGGEKVLLHFAQDSPGDYVPLENVVKALGITTSAQQGLRPQCHADVCTR
ncbi:hypothetical protein SKAU_G00158580 [Synaphobranchus kaupii]|uniref:Prostamide/prostaglandin F synthase n=1 Tax=Synaphobranchus kaupii TaxID=118154 RepID=A0A9Q1FI22_SYNKA|nr:hypothetical protein SKAU_G00158580 [Synaphobranchus kaupii]